mmetsp:Transcript_16664/g.47831  ORF Transcript_16664/g.47831 Transcript_16664/m.47831 type:complete len:238 (+) Transcript_16664:95-808(+)
MSLLERYLEFAVGSSIDIDVSPDIVWSVMSDIDKYSQVFWNVVKVERLDGNKVGGAIAVGSRYRIHRQTRQKERYFADWTVTALEPGRSITFFSHNIVSDGMTSCTTWSVAPLLPLESNQTGKRKKGVVRRLSGTLETIARRRSSNISLPDVDLAAIQAADGGDAKKSSEEVVMPAKSIATITLAVVPTKLFLIAGRLMCCCVYKQRALSATEEDLEDMAAASKKMFAEAAQKKLTD